MIELRDTVVIDVPSQVVWEWLETMPEHILEWHPDHISARWVRGCSFAPNAVLEVEELLHGKPHRLPMKIIEVEPGRRACYRVFPGLGGCVHVEPTDAGSRFTATIRLGFRMPVVGALVDALIRRALRERIEGIRRHQAEEGVNLKALLEGRSSPPSD